MKSKLALGLFLSLFFMYLSFWKTDFGLLFSGDVIAGLFSHPRLDLISVVEALKIAKYGYFIIIICLIYLGWWIRAWRWQIFILPVNRVKARPAFSALMVGYFGNTVLPLRIGEFMRAYVIAKHAKVPISTGLATVVVERIIDVLMLLLVLGFSIVFFPNIPDWLRTGGYSTFFMFGILVIFLLLLLFQRQKAMAIAGFLLRFLPVGVRQKILQIVNSFADGLEIFRRSEHYLLTIFWTLLMWGLYILIIRLSFNLFDFVSESYPEVYKAPLVASLVMMTITTLGISIPSAPGAVGTYHGICILGLSLFNISSDTAMSYALLMHVSNFIPMIIIGTYCLMREGLRITELSGAAKKADISPD